jgi:hypothetical protein
MHGQQKIKFDRKKLEKKIEGKLADNCMIFLKSLTNISVNADVKNAQTHMWKRIRR